MSIDNYAFAYCSSLKTMSIHTSETPMAGNKLFEGTDINNGTLYVPSDAVEEYASVYPWYSWGVIKSINNEESEGEDNDKQYDIVDGQIYNGSQIITCDQLTYTRTFSDTNWQALYVPFSMQYDDWKDNFEIAYLNDAHQFDDDDDGVIDRTVLESVKLKEGSKTEPNTPYMIKAKVTGSQTITLTDAMVYPAGENSFDVTSWFTKFIFTGTYHTVTNMATAGHYAMAKGGLMQATSDAATLGSFRWYLDVTDRYGNPTPLASKSIRLSFDDGETTDIDIINADSPRHAEVYSISGIQLKGKLPKGLYISNGKKVVIK